MAADRDAQTGRFQTGNPGGPGNPYTKQIAALRQALLDAVRPEDLREIVDSLVRQAKAGDVQAAREVLLRALGRPLEADLLERIEALEQRLAATPPDGRS